MSARDEAHDERTPRPHTRGEPIAIRGLDLVNRVVVVRPSHCPPGATREERAFLCETGPGCKPGSQGKVLGRWVIDPRGHDYIRRQMVQGLAPDIAPDITEEQSA